MREILAQFADDTNAFLTFDPVTVEAFCQSLTHIEANLGLKVSYEKNYSVQGWFYSEHQCAILYE